MNSLKYSSFLFAFYIFYSIPATIYKLAPYSFLRPEYILLILSMPLLLNLRVVNLRALILPIFFLIYLAFCILLTDVNRSTLLFTLPLIFVFGFFSTVVSTLTFSQFHFRKYLKLFSFVNLVLLLFLVVFRVDLYLNKDVMNYMTYGYWLLPSAIVFYYFYLFDNSKLMLVFSIFTALLIFSFGSRFGIVSYILGVLLLKYFFERMNNRTIIMSIVVLILSFAGLYYLEEILNFLISIFESFNLYPTSLYRLSNLFDDNVSSLSSGRDVIYSSLIDFLYQNPFGVGVYGYSHVLTGTSTIEYFKYAHNFILQVFLEFGIVFGMLILALLLMVIYINVKIIDKEKSWVFVILLSFNFKLIVTGTYLWEPAFWMCLALGLKNIHIHNHKVIS